MAVQGFTLPSAEDEYDKRLLENISKVGWHVVHVNGDQGRPSFAFTIGLFLKAGHPEILVMGLAPEVSQGLLNAAIVRVVGSKETLEPYKPYESIAEGTVIAFVPIKLPHYGEYLGYANWFYGSLKEPYPALQMVWPDRKGRLPWQAEYDERFIQLQKRLDQEP